MGVGRKIANGQSNGRIAGRPTCEGDSLFGERGKRHAETVTRLVLGLPVNPTDLKNITIGQAGALTVLLDEASYEVLSHPEKHLGDSSSVPVDLI